MKMRALLAAGCLCVSVFVPAAAAAPADPDSDPVGLTLGGTNVLRGRTSFTREVILPAPATISDKVMNNKDISMSGGGRVVGFSLVEADDPAQRPNELNGLQLRFCAFQGCSNSKTTEFLGMSGRFDPTDDKPLVLKPGRYLLTFIGDGAPARVSFELHGLVGTAKFKNGDKVTQFIGRPRRTYMSPSGTMYSAGNIDRVPENGISLAALQAQSEVSAEGQFGGCLRKQSGKPMPPERDYSMLCSMQGTQGAGAVFGPGLPPPAKRTVIAHWNTVEKGRWSHGVWAQTVVPDVAMQPLLFWLAYPEPLDRMSSSGMMMHWSSP